MSIPSDPIYCVRCKAQVDPSNPFCPKCGQSQIKSEGAQAQLYAPPPVVQPPTVYVPPSPPQPTVIHYHPPAPQIPRTGCLGILAGIVGTSAGLFQVLWGSLCLFLAFFATIIGGFFGLFLMLVIWLPLHGMLGVIKDATRPRR